MCDEGDFGFGATTADPATGAYTFAKLVCHSSNGTMYLRDAEATPAEIVALDSSWMLVCGALVFLMQAGFAMLEAGAVRSKNAINILFKNFLDVCVAAMVFWFFGYAFAYGGDATVDNGFIGASNFFLADEDGTTFTGYFFQFAFAATAATIVSGAVAERTRVGAYLIFSTVITSFIYPVVVHWVWDTEGWLSAFNPDPIFGGNGMIDFAGSGVVHMVGGWAGLMGALVVGPRMGRFKENADGSHGDPIPIHGHNQVLVALGVAILWFGWYGFNGGSTLTLIASINGATTAAHVAGLVFTTTTIAAAAGCLTATVLSKYLDGSYSLTSGLNGILAGLVSITAGCPVVRPWHALFIGIIGGAVYVLGSRLLLRLKIDDPLDAAPIHGFCGAWGVLAAGIFPTRATVLDGYGVDSDAMETGLQFGTQLVGVLAIIAWTVCTSFALFKGIDKLMGMRVSSATELRGLDTIEHGDSAYWKASTRNLGLQKRTLNTPVASAAESEDKLDSLTSPAAGAATPGGDTNTQDEKPTGDADEATDAAADPAAVAVEVGTSGEEKTAGAEGATTTTTTAAAAAGDA